MALKFFAIRDLVSKLSEIAAQNRHDQVARTIHDIFEKRAEVKPQTVVSSEDIKQIYSSVLNLNPRTEFKQYFSDIFEAPKEASVDETNKYRYADFTDDFRPTPVEIIKTQEQIIKDDTFEKIKSIASSKILDNPQYHYIDYVKANDLSGIALWNVSFNTRRGNANINVPVIISNGFVQEPKHFYTGLNKEARLFTQEELSDYSSEFNPGFREAQTELSGAENIGNQVLLNERYDIKENLNQEGIDINIAYTVPIDESLTSTVGQVQEELNKAIDQARTYLENKIKNGNDGRELNINMQICYGGELTIGKNNDSNNGYAQDSILAFTASQNTPRGLKTIAIPVVIKNNQCFASDFFSGTKAYELNAEEVNNFFSNTEGTTEQISSDAFSDAFLATDATLNQLRKELKASVDSNNISRATGCLQIIGEKFGQDAFKKASNDFVSFVKEAEESKENHIKCVGCPFFMQPSAKGATRTIPYCQKLSSDVSNIKRGNVTPRDCMKREANIIDSQNDKMYSNELSKYNVFMALED